MQSACAAEEASDNVAFCHLLKQNKKQVLKLPLTQLITGEIHRLAFFIPGHWTHKWVNSRLDAAAASESAGRWGQRGREIGLWWERGWGTQGLPSASLPLLIISSFSQPWPHGGKPRFFNSPNSSVPGATPRKPSPCHSRLLPEHSG